MPAQYVGLLDGQAINLPLSIERPAVLPELVM